ncbi:splicing factor 4 [Sarotherodon galilaeus]
MKLELQIKGAHECRNPHTNPHLRTTSQTWVIPGFSWVASKERLQEESQVLPPSNSVCSRFCTEEDGKEIKQPKEAGAGQLSECDALPRLFGHQRVETQECRKFQHHRALIKVGSLPHGDPVRSIKIPSITVHQKSSVVTEKSLLQESFISQVPLRLQIKVSGQRGSLGISIAGGKGSLPYKDHDEGIFISRVTEGGPSEKAGIHVGDRLLEVNGISMQGATHHEAVSALRNAGSCIKMKVLRERLLPRVVRDLDVSQDPRDAAGRQLCSQHGGGRSKQLKLESAEDCVSKKIEAVVCNGNGISDLESDLKRTVSELVAEALTKNDFLAGGKQTMTIPRIILTHPSTSDEDVELLTQSPCRELLRDFDGPGKRVHADRCDSAFCPP